jgi:hypothetical protein
MRIKRVTAIMALAATGAFPASAGAYQDLRNPDQVFPRPGNRPSQDLRNPDQQAPTPAIPEDPTPETVVRYVETSAPDGFDWSDAGVGAAGGLALITLAGGMVVAVTHRRRDAGIA